MKRLLSKHVQRYALFALLLLAFLLGSVSTYGFAGMDGQTVMAQAQGQDNTGDVSAEVAQKTPDVDMEEPETGKAEKKQEVNAEPAVEGENTGDPTPPPPQKIIQSLGQNLRIQHHQRQNSLTAMNQQR